jgi:SulP family sulfate permease
MSDPVAPAPNREWHLFIPKLITCLREGYDAKSLRADLFAGLTVAIVALPLSMALAIASGAPPERGLFTAVVAGFFVSALGGSRHQIGGPTGAFVVVVFNIIARFGYDGLVLATLMAGLMLIAAGLARLGTFIKYVPYPVVTGFTSGIAVVIFTSQVGDILGLTLGKVPGSVAGKWAAYGAHLSSFTPAAFALALGSLALILLARRYVPKAPGFLMAVVFSALAVTLLHLPVETIGSRFGAMPSMLPAPHWPAISWDRMVALFPSAFTIFILAGIESLLSAVVADGMTGRRHRSNCELVAQGVANIASVSFGGLPATGALARTATNIRAGARSPIAGIIHALAVLLIMVLFAPYASFIPLAALGAILAVVAWNMAEVKSFTLLLSAPPGDRLVLLLTFFLTIFVDLSVAIEVGMVLTAFLFMHRMANVVELSTHTKLLSEDVDDSAPSEAMEREAWPEGVEVFQLDGPFFFGVAARFEENLLRMGVGRTRAIILRMSRVPLIDSTGAAALKKIVGSASARGVLVILSGVQPAVAETLTRMKLDVRKAANFPEARAMAARLLEKAQ